LLALLAAPAAADQVNRIVLRVNDTIATLDDYVERRNARIEAITQAPDLSDAQRHQLVSEAGKQTMLEMFDEMLVLSRAQQLHIQAAPADVDRAVDQARRRYGIEDDEQFAQALKQAGMTIDEFRQRMSRNLLYDEVMQREVRPKVKVDDEAVAREYHAHSERYQEPEKRHVEEAIVRTAGAQPSDAERDLARRIRDGLSAGGRVADVVKQLGADEQAIVLDHDWIEKGALAGPLDTAVWELGAGGVAGPLEGRGGLHILHVVEIQPAGARPLETVRDEIRNRLLSEQYDSASKKLLDDIAASAYIVENLPPEAAGYREATISDDDPVRKLMRGPAAAGEVASPPPSEEPAAPSTDSSPPPAAQN